MNRLADVAAVVERWLPPGAHCIAGEVGPRHVRVVAHGAPAWVLFAAEYAAARELPVWLLLQVRPAGEA